MAYANETGKYAGIGYDEAFKKNNLVDFIIDMKPCNPAHKCCDSQECVEELLLRYSNTEQKNDIIENMDEYVHIKVE